MASLLSRGPHVSQAAASHANKCFPTSGPLLCPFPLPVMPPPWFFLIPRVSVPGQLLGRLLQPIGASGPRFLSYSLILAVFAFHPLITEIAHWPHDWL